MFVGTFGLFPWNLHWTLSRPSISVPWLYASRRGKFMFQVDLKFSPWVNFCVGSVGRELFPLNWTFHFIHSPRQNQWNFFSSFPLRIGDLCMSWLCRTQFMQFAYTSTSNLDVLNNLNSFQFRRAWNFPFLLVLPITVETELHLHSRPVIRTYFSDYRSALYNVCCSGYRFERSRHENALKFNLKSLSCKKCTSFSFFFLTSSYLGSPGWEGKFFLSTSAHPKSTWTPGHK